MPRVSVVLLAAGSSRRMGKPKQLLLLGDKPFIRHCLDTLIASEAKDIVVVLGRERRMVQATLEGLPVKVAVNIKPGSDMAESVRAGLRVADGHSTGIMVCLCDHPMVTVDTIRALIGCHAADPLSIFIPVCKGKRGHPSLFPAEIIREIYSSGDLREIISRYPRRVKYLDVSDEGTITDIDTMEDYGAIKGVKGAASNVEES